MKVSGDKFLASKTDAAFVDAQVGVYVGHRKELRETDIPCPYCREPMMEAIPVGRRHRIVQVLEERADTLLVIGQRIPASHRTLGCYGCRASFTVPA